MSIPDDVIEAMARGMFGQDWACGAPELEGFRKALAAAEAKGWKLVPREPTDSMLDAAIEEGGCFTSNRTHDGEFYIPTWEEMYDAAPSVKP